ncbi:MAG: hypothetical protein AABY83_00305 [Pseudomonadota bacterium]
MNMIFKSSLAFALGWALSSVTLASPSLSITPTVNWPTVSVSVDVSNSTPGLPYNPVAGMQFDIGYAATELAPNLNIPLGPAAAYHKIDVSVPVAGTLRVLLTPTGNNNSYVFAEGHLLDVTFSRVATATLHKTYLSLNTPVYGDSAADPVANGGTGYANVSWGDDLNGDGKADDFDGDGIPDTWDPDDDNDGLPDWYEDGYPGILNSKNAADAALDSDNDGLTNLQEYKYNTIPTNPDSDSDGVTDGAEIANKTNPRDDLIPVIMSIIQNLLLN